jgi:hypothetical protein
MSKRPRKAKKPEPRQGPLSLHPLQFEDALRALVDTPPEHGNGTRKQRRKAK